MHSQIVCAFDIVFSFWDPYYSVTSKGSDRMCALPVRVITKIEANQLNTMHLNTFRVVSSEHYGSTNRPGSSTSNLCTKGEITSNTVVS